MTNDDWNATNFAYTNSTFIDLYTSDNGGITWAYAGIVNDDNGLTDGFSLRRLRPDRARGLELTSRSRSPA